MAGSVCIAAPFGKGKDGTGFTDNPEVSSDRWFKEYAQFQQNYGDPKHKFALPCTHP